MTPLLRIYVAFLCGTLTALLLVGIACAYCSTEPIGIAAMSTQLYCSAWMGCFLLNDTKNHRTHWETQRHAEVQYAFGFIIGLNALPMLLATHISRQWKKLNIKD